MPSPYEQDYLSARKGIHLIEDDIADGWEQEWAKVGVVEIEEFLGKHAAFLAFLDAEPQTVSNEESES